MTEIQTLLDWNLPFDDTKLKILDQVVTAMFSGSNQDVINLDFTFLERISQ